MNEKKRKPKTGAARTEVFAMRLDPKLKYLAEIAARKQRRSLANFIEWTIELGLKNTALNDDAKHAVSVWDRSIALWDVDPPDRFAKLGFTAPELMNYDEQGIWKAICETEEIWENKAGPQGGVVWRVSKDTLKLEKLREYWNRLHAPTEKVLESNKSKVWGTW